MITYLKKLIENDGKNVYLFGAGSMEKKSQKV